MADDSPNSDKSRAGLRMTAPTLIGIGILVIQLGFIVRAQFDPARYFCWGMFDTVSNYQIQATVDGKELSAVEIKARYGRKARGLDAHSIQHLKDVIAQRERDSAQPAQVRLVYRINGKPEQEWTWAR